MAAIAGQTIELGRRPIGVPGRRRLEEPEGALEKLMLTILVLLEADHYFRQLEEQISFYMTFHAIVLISNQLKEQQR